MFSFRFCKCLGPFNMLTVEGCSERALFREWSNCLTVCHFGNTLAITIFSRLKMFKISCRFHKWKRRFSETGLTKFLTTCNFGNTLAMTIFFFFKMFKIWLRFHKRNKKLRKSFLFLRQLHSNKERQLLEFWKRMLVIGSHCVKKHPYDFKLQ